MQILISTDHNIKGSYEFLLENDKFEEKVLNALDHFQKQITRIEVHFSDVNGAKNKAMDKRCLIEARVSGVAPIIASHQARNLLAALEGASEKLKNSLKHALGKQKKH